MRPDIAVLIPTYNRPKIVARCVTALMQNLRYSGGIRYYVGVDDDDPRDTNAEFYYLPGRSLVTLLPGPKRGLGANLNMLIVETKEELILQLDDDHILARPLNLDRHAEELMTNEKAGWIRLMGVEGHRYEAKLLGRYWKVYWDSQDLYIPSNRPHLKHRRWFDTFPRYPEGLKVGETENEYCRNCKEIAIGLGYYAPHVLVPLDCGSEEGWDHVGESWQKRGL